MSWLFDGIYDWFKQVLLDAIMASFTSMFGMVNEQVTDIAAQVGQTPAGWNAGVFAMIRTLSETVVLPIAGMILTFVLCYELIQLIIEKNNLSDFDTFNIFKWIFSATRSHTNTIPQGIKFCGRLDHVVLKLGGFLCKKTTTDTLMSGMMG